MCDEAHFHKLEDKVEEHDDRIQALEKTDAVHDAKIDSLAKQAKFQMITVWAAFFLTLLALIYGALGPNGFNAVTTTAQQYQAK